MTLLSRADLFLNESYLHQIVTTLRLLIRKQANPKIQTHFHDLQIKEGKPEGKVIG